VSGARPLALPLACWLFAATPSAAQAEAEPSRGWLSDAATAVSNGFGSALDGASATLRTAWSFVLPEAPFDFVPERLGESDLAFIAMMQAANPAHHPRRAPAANRRTIPQQIAGIVRSMATPRR
jgi:hypothetical protein